MQRTSRETLVREIMTSAVIYVRADQTTDDCMSLMTRHRLRHLPVMEGDELLGMLSIGDLVNNIISEQRFVIEQLGTLHHRRLALAAIRPRTRHVAPVATSRQNSLLRQRWLPHIIMRILN